MIGGLQGEFGDLDIKYLKQNIPKCRSKISQDVGRKYLKMSVENIRKLQENTEEKNLKMSVAHIWKLQENTAALCKILPSAWSDLGKRYGGSGHVCPGNLKRLPLPSGCEISGCKMSTHGIPPRVE